MNRVQEAATDIGNCPLQEGDLFAELPAAGRPWSEIRTELLAKKRGDYDWRRGRISLYVYHDDDDLLSVSRDAYALYFSENALGGRAFPSLVSMERDILGMSLGLFNAPPGAEGSFTSGGTESIFLALKTARDYFRSEHGPGVRPRVIAGRTAHPAFDKAAHYLDVDMVRVGFDTEMRADVDAIADAVDSRTMMVVGSAPCYPYGVYDPIEALGRLAVEKNLWLHVDACLGGFLAPFAREEGFAIPEFDFRIPGVSSLSADLHKYGFSAKGASVVLYRSREKKAHQGFEFENWPRGTYATETFQGTRAGGVVASAWAVAQFLGRAGYRRLARKTMETKQRLVDGVERIPGLEAVRPSELCILLYRSVDQRLDINAVADLMAEQGWFVGRSREPAAIHFAVNAVHAPIVDEYVRDLGGAARQARMTGRVGRADDRTY